MSFNSPRDASPPDIAVVDQFGGTFPLMSIGRSKFMIAKKANAVAVEAIRKLGITRVDDGDHLVGDLSGGEQMADLEKEIEGYIAMNDGHAP